MTGFEPLIAAATAGLTTLVTDIIKGQGSNALTRLFSQDIGKGMQQAYFDASKKYIQTYAERHGSLKVLGMREPVSLESVYTTVQVLDYEDRTFASVEDLEKAFREAQKRRFRWQENSKQDGLEIANQKQYLMVLGAPGSGKSTFLRKMGLEALKGKQGGFKKHRCIPVLLELKRFTKAEVEIKKLITTEFQVCGFPNAERFTKKALEQGKLLILLDGLDEVPIANRDAVIEIIQDFVDQYDKNRYITSCRTAAYRHNFRRFTDVTIAEFDDDQIQQFIGNWFQSKVDQESGTAQRCWELLQQPENAAAKELAHTPLLLTFLCLVYDRSQTFSNNRSALYRKALRILLEEWAAEKRILRQEIYQGLNTELEEVLLSEIAASSFNADRLFLSQSELVDQIKTFLASNLNAPKHLSGEAVLDAIAMQQGVLVERAEDVYSFSHLTLQEYLTAKYIVDHRQIELLVKKYLGNQRWREVFLLVSGSMVIGSGADELLQTINQAIQTYAADISKLQVLLQWTNQITIPTANIQWAAAKRATVLQIALDLISPWSTPQDLAHSLVSALTRVERITYSLIVKLVQEVTSEKDFYSSSTSFDDNLRNRAIDFGLDFDRLPYGAYFPRLLNVQNLVDSPNSRERLSYLLSLLFETEKVESIDASFFESVSSSPLSYALNRSLSNKTASSFDRILAKGRDLARKVANTQLELFSKVDFSSLARELEALRTSVLNTDMSQVGQQQFADHLLQLYFDTFQLNSTLLNFTQKERNDIDSYLYMNLLMVQCQQEASRVSPQVWESILATMLTPADAVSS